MDVFISNIRIYGIQYILFEPRLVRKLFIKKNRILHCHLRISRITKPLLVYQHLKAQRFHSSNWIKENIPTGNWIAYMLRKNRKGKHMKYKQVSQPFHACCCCYSISIDNADIEWFVQPFFSQSQPFLRFFVVVVEWIHNWDYWKISI